MAATFKVGDRVQIVGCRDTGTVQETNGETVKVKWDSGPLYRYSQTSLVAAAAPRPEVKVGDRVKITGADLTLAQNYIGQIGTVVWVEPEERYQIQVIFADGSYWNYRSGEFDVLTADPPARQLQAGDTVRLKSGGPDLTIAYIYDDKKRARCEWFDDNDIGHGADFHIATLKVSDTVYV